MPSRWGAKEVLLTFLLTALILVSRGFRGFGMSSTAEFMDLILGAAYHPRSFFGPNSLLGSSREKILAGVAFLIPLENYSGSLRLQFSNSSKMDLGVYLAFQETFPSGLFKDLFVGYQIWLARGYTGVVPNVSSAISPVEIGLALVATYF